MIRQIDNLIDRLKEIEETENNGDRIKASRMLRDIDRDYRFLNQENRSECSEFIRRYQSRYRGEFKK